MEAQSLYSAEVKIEIDSVEFIERKVLKKVLRKVINIGKEIK